VIRGFLAGTLGLAVLYVVLQTGAAGRISEGGNVAVKGMRRLFDPTVAGIGDHTVAKKGDKNTISPATIYSGAGGGTAKAM
jgi:hypothetical protein